MKTNFTLFCKAFMIAVSAIWFNASVLNAQVVTTTTTNISYTLKNAAIVVDNSINVTSSSSITNVKVSISTNFSAGDVLSYSGTLPSGVTASYNSLTGILSFTGTALAAQWKALLKTVTFYSASNVTANREIVFSLGNLVASSTGHFYEFVPFGPLASDILTWPQAKAAAATRTYLGMQGYLATITSKEENDIIFQKLTASGWIGSSDGYQQINTAKGSTIYANQAASEGKWYWVTGPEAGTQFSNCSWVGATPTAVNGMYMNWNAGEPNNNHNNTQYGEYGEQYGEIYAGTSMGQPGKWNDFYSTNTDRNFVQGYVVEYGGMPLDPIAKTTDSRTIVITSSQSALPITGLKLSAENSDKSVLLRWSTYTEINNSHFEILRSTNGVDFESIGIFMAPAANSTTITNYQFKDNAPVAGINYYRLKQVDLDGHYTYSNILRIDRTQGSNSNWQAYPTQIQKGGNINLAINSADAKNVHAIMTNASGQKISDVSLQLQKGISLHGFAIANVAAGTYFLSVYDETGAKMLDTKRIIVQ